VQYSLSSDFFLAILSVLDGPQKLTSKTLPEKQIWFTLHFFGIAVFPILSIFYHCIANSSLFQKCCAQPLIGSGVLFLFPFCCSLENLLEIQSFTLLLALTAVVSKNPRKFTTLNNAANTKASSPPATASGSLQASMP
jgi:hypothetical protein